MRRPNIIRQIRETVRNAEPRAQIILYGSEARGDARPDSDIDLLILLDESEITPEREMEIIRLLYRVELMTGVIINPMVLPQEKWTNRPFQTPFSINVMNEGIAL